MDIHDSATCWTWLDAAARGDHRMRDWFVETYDPVLRAYFAARWRATPLAGSTGDAIGSVYVECLRAGGVLERATGGTTRGFRPYLLGAARNVARRIESEAARRFDAVATAVEPAADDTRLSAQFDRAWALSLLRQAREEQAKRARAAGADALRRVELLDLRFGEGLAIREIAARWNVEPRTVHRDYARARDEYRDALGAVIEFHEPDGSPNVDRRIARLIEILE